ncbi:MAG: hypothetical protein ACTHL8_21535 [Burkholderiaceae bacterium]
MRAPRRPRLAARLAAAIVLAAAGGANAAKVPMSDAELSGVSGQGVAILVHLELNAGLLTGAPIDSRFYAGFDVGGTTTYAIAQNFGGLLNLFAITLDPSTAPDGTGYLAIGMPNYLSAKDFGVRAIGVQVDPKGPINNSLGSLLLNGSANMTGQLNVWPAATK